MAGIAAGIAADAVARGGAGLPGDKVGGARYEPVQDVYNTFKQRLYVIRCWLSAQGEGPGRSTQGMPTIRLETLIAAAPDRCFDLSLSVDLHRQSVAHTHERPIAGVTTGVMRLGDTVTWEAVHFGIKQHLTTKITAYERPQYFVDEMIQGIFRELKHHHAFVLQPAGTLMIDTFTFRAPWGILGRVIEALILTRYMQGLLLARNRYLKHVAEADTLQTVR